MRKREASSVSIIGGADGPTSVFLCSNTKKTGIRAGIRKYCYQKKRLKVEKKIEANPHTLQEVIAYMKEVYGARELSRHSQRYSEQYKRVKESLIMQNQPALLGDLANVLPTKEFNAESVKEMMQQIEQREQKAASVPDEVFPMDYHVFRIVVPNVGNVEFEIDLRWDFISSSYTGSKKGMKELERISNDIYLYYGVTEDDIENRTERYKSLVAVLSS